MIQIRDALESDVAGIRHIYVATYGSDYAYPQYYDVALLKKMIFDDDSLIVVAEDDSTGNIVGTASVLLDYGAYADLVGEFGRLAVHPDVRGQGIGNQLMAGRLERVQDRIHVALLDGRVAHTFSQKIAVAHHFAAIGYMPHKLLLARRESVALFARYFGQALDLRRNHPRVIPEVFPLAAMSLANCGIDCHAIVDDESAPYPYNDGFRLEQLTTEGYGKLLHFQRGRITQCEIFGPMRLHYGLFKLEACHSNYLLACDDHTIVGAVGFIVDEMEKTARIVELISLNDEPLRFLIDQAARHCRERWGVEYLETDVSAFAARMQRTLLELDFLPAAYVPAMVFHNVERLDVIKMVRLLIPCPSEEAALIDADRRIAELVLDSFAQREIQPRVAQAIPEISLFAGLNDEQVCRLAGTCSVEVFTQGERIFSGGQRDGRTYIILGGKVDVSVDDQPQPIATVQAGECLGEMSLLSNAAHSATATAATEVETAVLTHQAINELVRRRPDVGVIIYRNLAAGLGRKLQRSDEQLGAYSPGDGVME